MADGTLSISVDIPELAAMTEAITNQTHTIGVLVAAVDNVLSKITELSDARLAELEQLRAVLADLQAQVAAGQVDQAKLDQAVTLLDGAIAAQHSFVEDAQSASTPEEPTPEPEPASEPTPGT